MNLFVWTISHKSWKNWMMSVVHRAYAIKIRLHVFYAKSTFLFCFFCSCGCCCFGFSRWILFQERFFYFMFLSRDDFIPKSVSILCLIKRISFFFWEYHFFHSLLLFGRRSIWITMVASRRTTLVNLTVVR